MIYSLFASDINGGFGFDKSLPWPFVDYDARRFVSNTVGKIVVMGYNTFQCLQTKPLENRFNIVVQNRTKNRMEEIYPFTLFVTFEELEPLLKKVSRNLDNEIFIIGGAHLIHSCLEYIDAVYITNILGTYKCNLFVDIKLIKEIFPYVTYCSKVFYDNGCMYCFEIRLNYNLAKIE